MLDPEWGNPSSNTVLTLKRKAHRLSRFLGSGEGYRKAIKNWNVLLLDDFNKVHKN